MLRKILVLVSILLFLCSSGIVLAQNHGQLYFNSMRIKDGLPGSTILDIVQDERGFIWIATNEGLCRFDGKDLKIFRHDPTNSHSIYDNLVQKLHLDKRGNLWVMTSQGLTHFNMELERFQSIAADSLNGGFADSSPTDAVETKDSTIFISSYYAGISYKKLDAERFSYINTSSNSKMKLSSNHINCLELINDSLLVIGYWDAGVEFFNIKNQTITSIEINVGKSISSKHVNTICKNRNAGIWIGTTAGLSYYNIQKQQLTNYDFNETNSSFLPDNDILSIMLDKDNYLWLGTRNGGMVVVHQDDILQNGLKAKSEKYYPSELPGSLSYRTVSTIFQDKDLNVWIGTYGGGLNLVEERQQRFNILDYNPTTNYTLASNNVWGITEDRAGNIWIGTDGDGVNVWNPTKGLIKKFRYSNRDGQLSDNAILCAKTDYRGNVWLGTYKGGINRYIPKLDKFKTYSYPELPKNDVRCIYESNDNQLWIGLNGGGLAKYDQSNDKFDPIAELSGQDIRSIISDKHTLWIGTYNSGLIRYNSATSEVKVFPIKIPGTETIFKSVIFALCKTDDNSIWVATNNFGLFRFNIQNELFSLAMDESKGLADNNINAIIEDVRGNLWMSTNKGISKYSTQTNNVVNYGWHKGIQTEEFHNGSCLKASTGYFYFGGISGLNYFKPENFYRAPKPINIQFTGLKILNSDIKPGDDNIIDKSIEFKPTVTLKYKHSVVTFEFQSVEYTNDSENQLAYILEDYETEWNLTNGQNYATYRNLPQGTYTFRVKSIKKGNEGETFENDITVQVIPPFWKSKLALILYLIFIMLVVTFLVRYRIQQYNIKNKLIYEQRLRNKEKNLHNERLEFFTNISHELRTPLTIIGIDVDEINKLQLNNPKLNRLTQSALVNINRLVELVNRVLEFRKVESGVSDLKISEINLNYFLTEFLQGFIVLANHKKINLKFMAPVGDIKLWIDQDKLSMILNNLLSNAFKHTPESGIILIKVDDDDQNISITVEDNGDGIPKSMQVKIFDRYVKLDKDSTSTGIGLALTKSLVEMHQGKIELSSDVGKGSSFKVYLKKGYSHYPNSIIYGKNAEETNQSLVLDDNEGDEILFDNKKKFVLLIDDNVEILELLDDNFKQNFNVIKALNGNDGLTLARKYSPDIIILDIMMPGINGIEVCRQLKNESITSHIPIVLLTAKVTEEDEIKGLNTGADDYVSKPFKVSILKARVNSIIENRIKILNYFTQKPELLIEETNPQQQKEINFLKKFEEYILDNCLDAEVSVFVLAKELGFSRTTLYRKIKTLTGMSINGFVRSVRIKKSAELIKEGKNVSEAAYATGFNDLKYFRESFKQIFGKNPSELK